MNEWDWRAEVAKRLPQINVMSFVGARPTIRWVFERVTILPEAVLESLKPHPAPPADHPYLVEIAKHLPQVTSTGLTQPAAVVSWLFAQLTINDKDAELAAKLLAIGNGQDDESSDRRLQVIFPNLGPRLN